MAITETNDCAMVTAAQLSGIMTLDLSDLTPNDDMDDIISLMSGDFAGLTELETLILSDNMVSSLEEQVFSPLSAVTNLNLSGNMFSSLDGSLTALTALNALTTLHLSNNQLTDLPENFFTVLPSLEGVDLSNNPSPDPSAEPPVTAMDIALTMTPREIEIIPDDDRQFNDPYQFVIEILQGAPVNITINVSITAGGTFSDNRMTAKNVTILEGMRESERFEITPDVGHTEITLTTASTTSLSSFVANTGAGYSGLAIVGEMWTRQVGICSRSESIQTAILFAIPEDEDEDVVPQVPDCMNVTGEQLAALTSLPLNNEDINELLPGDLAGLSMVTSLNLSGNGLSNLPDDVFSDLDALTMLDLSDNALTNVNTLSFPNTLTELNLSGNALRSLTPNIFSAITALTILDLSDNELTDLPSGFFSGLVALAGADLSGNPASGTPSPLTLTLTPRERTSNMFFIEVIEGAPTELTATVQIRGGTFVNGATETEMTIEKGMTRSDPIEFVMPAEEPTTVILVADSASDPSNLLNGYSLPGRPRGNGYSGLELAEGEPLVIGNGICNRTPRVQAAILNEINRRSGLIGTVIAEDDCRVVVNADLTVITELDVSDPTPNDDPADDIRTLLPGDFAGLVNMEVLNLESNQLSELPANIFSGLESLRALDLSGNAFDEFA